MKARTLLGDVAGTELGLVDAHEHLLTATTRCFQRPSLILDRLDAAVAELRQFRAAGGGTLVELTALGYGRNAVGLSIIARQTKTHIIGATGFYKAEYMPSWVLKASVDEIRDFLLREINIGFFDAQTRAGIIKVATSAPRILPVEEKVLKAAAQAQAECGAPIATHCEQGMLASDQLDILASEGANLARVACGHVDLNPDLDYYRAIAAKGAIIQFDRIGHAGPVTDMMRIELLRMLQEEGLSSHIMLGMDLGATEYWHAYGGSPGFSYLLGVFKERAMSAGVREETILACLRDNPSKFLSFIVEKGVDAE